MVLCMLKNPALATITTSGNSGVYRGSVCHEFKTASALADMNTRHTRAYNICTGLFQAPYYAFSQTMMAELTPPGFENMARPPLLRAPNTS